MAMLSEKDFINKFIKPLGKNNKNSFGFNDDVAVVNNYAYSTDTIVEGIHFFKDDNPCLHISVIFLKVFSSLDSN